jgi:hypothetical protein
MILFYTINKKDIITIINNRINEFLNITSRSSSYKNGAFDVGSIEGTVSTTRNARVSP